MSREVVAAYLTAVVAIGGLSLLLSLRWLGRATRVRLLRFGARRRIESVSPSETHPGGIALERRRGVQNIQRTATVARRLLIPVIIAITAIFAAVPFLTQVPAALLSLLVAMGAVLLGIAARPAVENAVAGLVIALSRHINIGDTVRIDDWYGTIEDISLTHTTVKVWDCRRYLLPNTQVLQTRILKYTHPDSQLWATIEFWVSYDADIDQVTSLAQAAAKKSLHCNVREEIGCWVMEMAREGVKLWLAAWADSPSAAWTLQVEMRTELVRSLKAAGIATHAYHHDLADPPAGLRLAAKMGMPQA